MQVRSGGNNQVAELSNETVNSFDEVEANARLIAAAPEMLAQLKVLRDKLSQYAGPEAALYEIGDTNQIIAKAEGRDQ